jgi:hypothetical protein
MTNLVKNMQKKKPSSQAGKYHIFRHDYDELQVSKKDAWKKIIV